MDTDQLKMILDALQSVGADGKTALIWWLVLDKALPVLGWLVTFAGLVWLVKYIADKATVNTVGVRLRDILGIGSPGPMTSYEAAEVEEAVRKLAQKHRAG